MKIDIRFLGLEASGALRYHIVRRVYFQLGRFGHEIAEVVVRIKQASGPRGASDKRSQVVVSGPRISTATVEDEGGDAYTAVDLALGRVAQTVSRAIERARSHRGAPLPAWKASRAS